MKYAWRPRGALPSARPMRQRRHVSVAPCFRSPMSWECSIKGRRRQTVVTAINRCRDGTNQADYRSFAAQHTTSIRSRPWGKPGRHRFAKGLSPPVFCPYPGRRIELPLLSPSPVNGVPTAHLLSNKDAQDLSAVTKIGYRKVGAISSWQAPGFVQKN